MKGMTSSLLGRMSYYQGFPILWSGQGHKDFRQKLSWFLETKECEQGTTILNFSWIWNNKHILGIENWHEFMGDKIHCHLGHRLILPKK